MPRSGWLPIALPFDYWLPRRGVVLAGDSDREPQPNFELDGVMVPGGPPRQVRWLRPEAAVFLWLLPLGGYITLWLAAGATLLSSLPIGPQSTLYYVAILGALSALFTWLTLRAVELWPVLPRISELRLVA